MTKNALAVHFQFLCRSYSLKTTPNIWCTFIPGSLVSNDIKVEATQTEQYDCGAPSFLHWCFVLKYICYICRNHRVRFCYEGPKSSAFSTANIFIFSSEMKEELSDNQNQGTFRNKFMNYWVKERKCSSLMCGKQPAVLFWFLNLSNSIGPFSVLMKHNIIFKAIFLACSLQGPKCELSKC